MRQLSIIALFTIYLCPVNSFAQNILLIKDSIMNTYMESGYASKHFRPKGKIDKEYMRQGKWKDYEVMVDGSYQVVDGAPMKTISNYLFYGEGEFVDNKRTGEWKIYVIEDKTHKKILSQKLTYQEGKPAGQFEYYYPNGKLAQTGNYSEGKIDGNSTMYYPDGSVFAKQIYSDGLKNGIQKYFYASGEFHFTYSYVNGKKDGKYESYYKDGKMKETFNCVADSLDGIYLYYYPSGKLWTEKTYQLGRLINVKVVYDKDGKELDKGTLKDGNGYINYYTENGKIYSVETYKDGTKIKQEDR